MTDAAFREPDRCHPDRRSAAFADPQSANISVTILQLSNIAWIVNRELNIDTKNGHIKNDPEAMKMWAREYEKGWEVTV